MRKFAISDIHGNNKTFLQVLEKIQLTKSDELFLLGDFIDRGPDSKGVFDSIFKLIEDGYKVNCTLGNHEELMIMSRAFDRRARLVWMRNGGIQTLDSFDVKTVEDIENKYWNFINKFPLYILVDNYILVHAGLGFTGTNPLDNKDDMLWIRRWYEQIDLDWLGDRFIIHGHTPTPKSVIKQMLNNINTTRVLNIDCGCYHIDKPDYGNLCAFDMTNQKLYFQENVDFK